MLRIGLTGGIGSGKTMVCKIFEKLSIPVFFADLYAKELMNTDSEITNTLKMLFGNEIYLPDGTIHRKKLAEIIFNDTFALQKVNAIVHPKVRSQFNSWAECQSTPYVIQEAAILFESQQQYLFDKIITVTASRETRIERVMQRDKITRNQVMERMKNQIPDEDKIKKSDFIIYNNNNDMVLNQILNIHKRLI